MAQSRKIINDPIYGFITVGSDLIFELIEHRYFQRLRRIRQLGLTGLVYPGATHTRFHHALGAMHLMHRAIGVLRSKGVDINEEEELAAKVAILLHDIGHGPFSHVLEHSIVQGIKHEEISLHFMRLLNVEFNGQLGMAIDIFTNNYSKKFLHQLVSSQLDMDRLDYLTRDSFYTGVSEGIVGLERIIQMINVTDDTLVIDEKGIYSIEKFIMARRLMYWQVYLHKTALAADEVLLSIIRRAKWLIKNGRDIFMLPKLGYFFNQDVKPSDFEDNQEVLDMFNSLDDMEVLSCIKYWLEDEDPVLSKLSNNMINRRLPRIEMQKGPFESSRITAQVQEVAKRFSLTLEEASYFATHGVAENEAYHSESEKILIRRKNGEIVDLIHASDNYNFLNPNSLVRKYFLCTPK